MASALHKNDHRLLDAEPLTGVEQDELRRLRADRIKEMQKEQVWRQSGQGSLRELEDEIEFMEVLQPRERGVVLIFDGASDLRAELLEVFEELAEKCVETQFCHLELENAGLLAHAVDLDEGVPVVFVLSHGKLTTSLPPSKLFELGAVTSSKFRQHIRSLLQSLGAIFPESEPKNADSDSEACVSEAPSLD
eukprot:TRINITY_DN93899_c0_g1_i1.p1 TRINITY_DN93899_c0_g1~~TRINITY_DN93899_c0_g1_i1.p1  ORF type:complete len:209 (+),score=45.13 TRINITY_DN93899_c0_g1_i1:52-627(+)